MKNIVLIGDSIRIGYQDRVRELLGPEYQVFSPKENCRYSKFALWGMFSWMESWGNPKVDLIHWNAGIWDLHRCTVDGEVFTPLPEYLETNRRLTLQMECYTKNLIWATTIPGSGALDQRKPINSLINTEKAAPPVYLTAPQEIWNRDVRRYNDALRAQMEARGVRIDDLYGVIDADIEGYISGDGIHPNPAGYEALAQKVAAEIKAVI